jgi:hypothetical protein
MKTARIYKLIDNTKPDTFYIGSTTKPSIQNRLWYHKSDYKRFLNQKYCYVSSFEIIKNGDFSIELLEQVEIETHKQLVDIENDYIRLHRKTSNVVNILPITKIITDSSKIA